MTLEFYNRSQAWLFFFASYLAFFLSSSKKWRDWNRLRSTVTDKKSKKTTTHLCNWSWRHHLVLTFSSAKTKRNQKKKKMETSYGREAQRRLASSQSVVWSAFWLLHTQADAFMATLLWSACGSAPVRRSGPQAHRVDSAPLRQVPEWTKCSSREKRKEKKVEKPFYSDSEGESGPTESADSGNSPALLARMS